MFLKIVYLNPCKGQTDLSYLFLSQVSSWLYTVKLKFADFVLVKFAAIVKLH